jgi:AcrR family transcriptional regulator
MTMRDIAAEFEKSRSLIHYHYDTKADLLADLFEYLVARDEQRMLDAVADHTDPVAMLDEFLDLSVFGPDDPTFDHWAFFTAFLEFRSHAHRDDRYQAALQRSYQNVVDIVGAIVDAGIEQGVFRPVDADAFAHFLTITVDAVRVRRITLGHENAPEDGRRAIDEFVIRPLLVSPED